MQSPKLTVKASPFESEIAPLPKLRHRSCPLRAPLIDNNTPSPAGIVAPENEKPRMVFPPEETVNPASAAEPPDVLKLLNPEISN